MSVRDETRRQPRIRLRCDYLYFCRNGVTLPRGWPDPGPPGHQPQAVPGDHHHNRGGPYKVSTANHLLKDTWFDRRGLMGMNFWGQYIVITVVNINTVNWWGWLDGPEMRNNAGLLSVMPSYYVRQCHWEPISVNWKACPGTNTSLKEGQKRSTKFGLQAKLRAQVEE